MEKKRSKISKILWKGIGLNIEKTIKKICERKIK